MLETLEKRFRRAVPAVDFCSLRYVCERDEVLTVRQDIPQPVFRAEDAGAMMTVMNGGGLGYAATSDLSAGGLKAAIDRACAWAERTAGRCVTDYRKVSLPDPQGEYVGPEGRPWASASLADKLDLLMALSKALRIDGRIVDWEASLWHTATEQLYITAGGGRVHQRFSYIVPGMRAVANAKAETQSRSFGGLRENCRQGGLEVLDEVGFRDQPERIASEALELLAAPNCPTGKTDVLLAADQMILQIHESIGHPLELDRILGDERNYAGTSFVTPEMFGTYRYGTEMLNVAYDPTRAEQFATFAYDDEGAAAEKTYLIEKGILKRPLGGITSQARAGIDGVACCRATMWNRPPIDRMANLNLEPGTSTLDEMVAATKRGIYMKANRSWSIDDSRNKFQFGCEWARLIEDGELTTLVKNPNYRGISATFWRSLKAVGDESTFQVMGTPFCGKGEPNQIIRVGHASPAALFEGVDVFGGE
ncbi:MAG TPA: TldD/PmbA family protein [Phycisphaerae bacterium]|nr:TldD/PmbA family protein [Phycisphaerae bacterium]